MVLRSSAPFLSKGFGPAKLKGLRHVPGRSATQCINDLFSPSCIWTWIKHRRVKDSSSSAMYSNRSCISQIFRTVPTLKKDSAYPPFEPQTSSRFIGANEGSTAGLERACNSKKNCCSKKFVPLWPVLDQCTTTMDVRSIPTASTNLFPFCWNFHHEGLYSACDIAHSKCLLEDVWS